MLYGQEHVRRYEETDGAEGHIWQDGAPTLILRTKGRKTGQERKLPLIYQQVGDSYVIVASHGGAPQHPSWYLNLLEEPEVGVQVLADKFTARARTATAEERPALWPTMTKVWPAYDEYQKKTEREIPLVVLDRV